MRDKRPAATRTCPTCGHVGLEDRVISERFEFGAEEGIIWVEAHGLPVEACPACGETLSGLEAGLIRHDAICRALGQLVPSEIRALRERCEMTQEQFAEWLDVGVAFVSRWERGGWIPTRAYDHLMRTKAENRLLNQVVEAVPEAKRLFDALLAAS